MHFESRVLQCHTFTCAAFQLTLFPRLANNCCHVMFLIGIITYSILKCLHSCNNIQLHLAKSVLGKEDYWKKFSLLNTSDFCQNALAKTNPIQRDDFLVQFLCDRAGVCVFLYVFEDLNKRIAGPLM